MATFVKEGAAEKGKDGGYLAIKGRDKYSALEICSMLINLDKVDINYYIFHKYSNILCFSGCTLMS